MHVSPLLVVALLQVLAALTSTAAAPASNADPVKGALLNVTHAPAAWHRDDVEVQGFYHIATVGAHWRSILEEQMCLVAGSPAGRLTRRLSISVNTAPECHQHAAGRLLRAPRKGHGRQGSHNVLCGEESLAAVRQVVDEVRNRPDECGTGLPQPDSVRVYAGASEYPDSMSELPSMRSLYAFCQQDAGMSRPARRAAWYIHAKGVRGKPGAAEWRHRMQNYVLLEADECLSAMFRPEGGAYGCGSDSRAHPVGAQGYGMHLKHMPEFLDPLRSRYHFHFFYGGNFWWARCDCAAALRRPDAFADEYERGPLHILYTVAILNFTVAVSSPLVLAVVLWRCLCQPGQAASATCGTAQRCGTPRNPPRRGSTAADRWCARPVTFVRRTLTHATWRCLALLYCAGVLLTWLVLDAVVVRPHLMPAGRRYAMEQWLHTASASAPEACRTPYCLDVPGGRCPTT